MPNPKLPVIVLTGFLGSGKTTLLNHMLSDGLKTAVIINEFGETAVDQNLLQAQDLSMTVLAGGCLCCQIKGTLTPTLKNLWMTWQRATDKPVERVIIETSGVASPEPILDTLLRERWIAERYQLQQIVTTLAIPAALQHLSDYAEARAQVVWADTLLLTHADLATVEQRIALSAQLNTLAPATPIAHDPKALANQTTPLLRRLPEGQTVAHGFSSLSCYWPKSMAWSQVQALLTQIINDEDARIVRIKGVLLLQDYAEPQVLQVANGITHPLTALSLGGDQSALGRLVLIAHGDLQRVVTLLTEASEHNALRLH